MIDLKQIRDICDKNNRDCGGCILMHLCVVLFGSASPHEWKDVFISELTEVLDRENRINKDSDYTKCAKIECNNYVDFEGQFCDICMTNG